MKYTEEEFREAVRISNSIKETLDKLGMASGGASYKTFHSAVKKYNIDYSHFGQNKNRVYTPKRTLEELLILADGPGDYYLGSHKLKLRLYREGLLEPKCKICKIENWNDQELAFELDHINGIRWDNRLENLRILCPNCHSQQDTSKGKRLKKNSKYCSDCGTNISPAAERCKPCASPLIKRKYKIDWPPMDELRQMVNQSNRSKVAKQLGVSDNAIKKRLKAAAE